MSRSTGKPSNDGATVNSQIGLLIGWHLTNTDWLYISYPNRANTLTANK